MLSPLLLVGLGLIVLTGGAELLVRGAASLARRLGVSALVVGLTVVSVGTSLPELVVNLDAAFQGAGGIGLGNVVGSNISNIALILGAAALVRPLRVQAQVIRVDAPILVLVSAGLVALGWDGYLGRLDGLLLTGGIVGYVAYNVHLAQEASSAVQEEFQDAVSSVQPWWLDGGFIVFGLVGLVGGGHLLVEGAVEIAQTLGVRRIVIGLSVVAVGTSLPELATSVVAAYREQGDLAIGNALGSSIFNILGILGVTVLIHPLSTENLGIGEVAFMVGLAVVAVPLLRTQFALSRTEGALLVGSYLGYLAYLAVLM